MAMTKEQRVGRVPSPTGSPRVTVEDAHERAGTDRLLDGIRAAAFAAIRPAITTASESWWAYPDRHNPDASGLDYISECVKEFASHDHNWTPDALEEIRLTAKIVAGILLGPAVTHIHDKFWTIVEIVDPLTVRPRYPDSMEEHAAAVLAHAPELSADVRTALTLVLDGMNFDDAVVAAELLAVTA